MAMGGGIHPQKHMDDIAAAASAARESGIKAGKDAGWRAGINAVGNNPDMAKAILKRMAPEVRQQAVSPSIVKDVLRDMNSKDRDKIVKSFSGGFGDMLRRWMGG